ncbi:MAG TPA: hypothetical protein PLP21_02000 [Pyrinomonadaceae bacterium]|nr:hypothetical protein [Acidobacteriota bacterium]HQZ95057.1 hypothetical protein [Pyrinomonadaceae bacterium]
MFNLKAKSLLATAVLFLGGVVAANAQISNGSIITVSVPNSFVVKDSTFEAGVYTIERTPNTSDSPSLLILRGNGEAIIFDTVVSSSDEVSATTQLVFDTVGDTNFLSEILVKGSASKNELMKTKAQKKVMSESSSVRNYLTITNTGF